MISKVSDSKGNKGNVFDTAKAKWVDRVDRDAAQSIPVRWNTVSAIVGSVVGLIGLVLTILFGVASVIDSRFTSFSHDVDRVNTNVDRVQHSVDRLQESSARERSALGTSIGEIRQDLQGIADDVEELKNRQ